MEKTYTVSERKMAGVYSDTITKIMRENKNVVELEADLGGCIMGSKMDEIDQYPGQLVNCGIQEANMVGVACGMSAAGKIPFVHSFAPFISRIVSAIRFGFSSVMIDRSMVPYEENVREVAEIVKIAHAVGVSVEAELGHVGQGFEYEETRNAGLTNPEEAVSFVKETGIDCLAVAVGTSHGVYKGKPHLEFDLLSELSEKIQIPLVLHGGSGTGDDNLAKAVCCGIQKVNLFTDLSNAGLKSLMKYLGIDWDQMQQDGTKGEFANMKANLCDAGLEAGKGYKELLCHYIELFGGVGKI